NHVFAVAELGSDFHRTRDAGQFLNPVAGYHAGMVRSATGDDLDVADVIQQVGRVGSQCLLQNPAVGNPAFHGGLDHFRLLVDFLEHEVAVLTFVRRVSTVFKTGNGPLHRLTAAVVDADAVLADIGDIALFQEHEAVGHR